jgi:hypothetical protein
LSITLLSFFKKKISPKWTFQKPGFIWRALFLERRAQPSGEAASFIIGEHRTKGKREASFFLLDTNGKPVWENFILTDTDSKPVGDGWWVGIEQVYQNLFFIHGYYSPSVPEHRGIWAIDSASKKIVWENVNAAFLCLVGSEILVAEDRLVEGFAERRFFVLDAATGTLVTDLGGDIDAAESLRARSQDFAAAQGVTLPVRYSEQSPQFFRYDAFAKKTVSAKQMVAGYDVIDLGTKTLLGYHEQTDKLVPNQSGAPVKALRYRLFALEGETMVYQDTLGESMSGLLIDGFFTRGSTLYYVKNDDTLVAVDL